MRKNLKILATCLAILLIALIIALVFGINCIADPLKNTVIITKDGVQKTLRVDIRDIYPGETREYKINLKGNDLAEYRVYMAFVGEYDDVLCDFVTVAIVTERGVVEKDLSELFSGEEINLGKAIDEITVKYSMSEDAGNEVQGCAFSFLIEITAVKSVL